jgi:hypothetical protein
VEPTIVALMLIATVIAPDASMTSSGERPE